MPVFLQAVTHASGSRQSDRRPDATTAATHYGAAMSLAVELEMRPLVAHCHFGLGRVPADG
jgi:hypothetical protein